MQTVTLTTFGPGRNWQKLRTPANSASPNQPRSSTMMRRAQTIGPPKPYIENFRKGPKSAPQGSRGGLASMSCRADNFPDASLPCSGRHPGEGRNPPFKRRCDCRVGPGFRRDDGSTREAALEGGPHRALRVHRIGGQRHHAEKGVDHACIVAVLDRHAGVAQCRGVALTLIVQNIAFGGDDERRRGSGKARRLERRSPPILCVLGAAPKIGMPTKTQTPPPPRP